MRFAILPVLTLALLSTVAPGQSTQHAKAEISGVVLDPTTHEAVAGAEIALFTQEPGSAPVNGGWKADESTRAKTDDDGAFAISPTKLGSYRVQASKPGWGPSSSAQNYADVKLTDEEPAADVNLYLGQFGALSGIVIDGETRKPIPNLQLRAVRESTGATRRFVSSVATHTGLDGQFLAFGLPPGEYVVEILPQTSPGKRLLTSFTEKDLDVTDPDYEQAYWPGGQGQEAALPVTVLPGSTVKLGAIYAMKAWYYRVHVRIPASNCEPGDTMSISESTADSTGGFSFPSLLGKAPCGRDFLITGYPRGTFRLFLNIDGRGPENRGTASVPFAISDRNITIAAPIMAGVDVDGIIAVAEGSTPPDMSNLTLWLRAADGQGNPDTVSLRAIDGQSNPDDGRPTPGRFRIAGMRPVRQSILVSGVDRAHYVQEIRYNGRVLKEWVVPLDEPAATHTLTIVVDDKVATIAGLVTTANGGVSGANVFAVRWPMDQATSGSGAARGQTDAMGHFQITGLAPGEYRVLALAFVPQDIAARITNAASGTFERFIAAGTKVELSPGALENISLAPAVLPPQ